MNIRRHSDVDWCWSLKIKSLLHDHFVNGTACSANVQHLSIFTCVFKKCSIILAPSSRSLTQVTTTLQHFSRMKYLSAVGTVCPATTKKVWYGGLHRSQMFNLRSTLSSNRTAAIVTTRAWRQILHGLEVTQATMEFQVQSYANSEFDLKCKY